MGVHSATAQQWFLSSFVRSAHGAGASAPEEEIRGTGQELLDRWSQPGRHFHNLRHLADVLRRVDQLAEETHEPDLVRLAAWYHGAVFSADDKDAGTERGGEDETASALLAVEELSRLGVPEQHARRVAEMVTALQHHAPDPTDFDCAVLCDADLSMLAVEPQRYQQYRRDVRAEFGHIPDERYLRTRIAILTKLLRRKSLFFSPLGAAWEEPARENLTAELHRLKKAWAKLEAEQAVEVGGVGAGGSEADPDDGSDRAGAVSASGGERDASASSECSGPAVRVFEA